jgi:outer membrane protein OmpA-like peptidoglycan-associated protein
VRLLTTGPDGQPIDATVTFRGPADQRPLTTGPTGEGRTTLQPGTWSIYASAGDLAASAVVTVSLGVDPRAVELALRPAGAVMTGESVRIKEMIQFDFNKASLRDDSVPILEEVARVLKSQPDIVRVEVQGHTDALGSPAVNAALSQARAEAVVGALVALGVPKETLYARGYGQTRPMGDNGTDEGRAANRRVQFEVVERGEVR